ncbi:hypothetical protein [Roseiconus lacunae]|uniref:hypothetical protein n=1 Tax=Roseiconus lacunae TaxID=2605694 RepID=UPI001E5D6AA7|nr:hypothetical protein [Roseiconus lacunae]MCD0458930.1 hypothetical protein [Roseiconus lacunae]
MDSDKLKDFALYNFEKLIVLIVVAMSGFLVWVGYGKEDIRKTRDPENLTTRANQVRNEVDNDHTEQVLDGRRPEFDIAEAQSKFLNAIPASMYTPELWEPSKVAANKVRRQDPELGKPEGIRVQGVIASMAFRSKDGLYALSELEPADPVEVVEQKPRSRRSRRRNNGMADMYGMEDQGGMDMGYEMEMMMEMGGGPSGIGAGAAASGPIRKLSPDKNLGTKAEATRSLGSGEEQPPVPGIGLFIAGSAAIPHADLIKSYQEALSYSAGYNPRTRDLPRYLAYQVQRADVTNMSVDALTEEDWILRDTNEKTIVNAANYWSGFAPEVIPRDYWIPGVTMWVPPVLLDPYTDIATHPLIPLKTQRELMQEEMDREAQKAKNSGPVDMSKFQVDIAGGATHNMAGGYGGMDDMGYGMDMGMDMGMGDDMGYGGYGGGSRGMEGQPAEENPVDYKLLRFYDFAYLRGAKRDPNIPRPGKTYVYRVRFGVNDPNFPQKPELQPKGKTLAPDAYQRVVSLAAAAEQNQKREFTRWSDWSDISEPVSLPAKFDRSYVGPVKSEKSKYLRLGTRMIVAEGESPTADVVASSFDIRLGTFVPTTMKATEGTVLSKKVESADVVDPITLEVKKTGEAIIESATTIVDIEGGVPLPVAGKENEDLTSPGMILMIDSNGKLQVRDSVEEQRIYRIKSFAEERGL